MLKRVLQPVALAASMAFVTTAAHAAFMDVEKQDVSATFGSNGSAVVTLFDDDVDGYANGKKVRGGAFALTMDPIGDFVAFCLDISTVLNLTSTYDVQEDYAGFEVFANTTPISSARKSLVQKLFDTAYSGLDLSDRRDSTGFQLALWEVLYEDESTFDIHSGSFIATRDPNSQAVLDWANGFLAGMSGPATPTRLTFLESNEVDGNGGHLSQNLVAVLPVPLPATGLLLLGGLGGLAALRRRKTRG